MAKSKFLEEFKTFALRGNVLDLAVGVIIGGAFQKIVTSVVNDLIMPLVGLMTGGVNFNDQFLILKLPEGVKSIPIAAWEKEYAELAAQSKAGYAKLKAARAEVAELQNIRK